MFGALGFVGDPFSLQALASAQTAAAVYANRTAQHQFVAGFWYGAPPLWALATQKLMFQQVSDRLSPYINTPSTWSEWSALMSAEPMGNP